MESHPISDANAIHGPSWLESRSTEQYIEGTPKFSECEGKRTSVESRKRCQALAESRLFPLRSYAEDKTRSGNTKRCQSTPAKQTSARHVPYRQYIGQSPAVQPAFVPRTKTQNLNLYMFVYLRLASSLVRTRIGRFCGQHQEY